MEKYVAVIMRDVRIQLAIPVRWYGTLDSNGYNRGINKNVTRRIFFSPFGYDVEPDFDLPISQRSQRNANACYHVKFLQLCDSKDECIQYMINRRVMYPAVYNDLRLQEYIPPPRQERQRLVPERPRPVDEEIAAPVVNGNGQNDEQIDANAAGAIDQLAANERPRPVDEDVAAPFVNEDGQNDEQIDANAAGAIDQNGPAVDDVNGAISGNIDGNFTDADDSPVINEMPIEVAYRNVVNSGNIDQNMHRMANQFAPTMSINSNAGNLFDTVRIKEQIKIETRNRIFAANEQNPVVDLTTESCMGADRNENGSSVENINNRSSQIAANESVHNILAQVQHSPRTSTSAVASTSTATSKNCSAENIFDAIRIKEEIKIETRNRILTANEQNPVLDLTTDPDEEEALLAADNNFNLDDSDDDIQILSDLVTSRKIVPNQIKFEFDGHDILSGDIPFITNVR